MVVVFRFEPDFQLRTHFSKTDGKFNGNPFTSWAVVTYELTDKLTDTRRSSQTHFYAYLQRTQTAYGTRACATEETATACACVSEVSHQNTKITKIRCRLG
jgi:hypothetical protein